MHLLFIQMDGLSYEGLTQALSQNLLPQFGQGLEQLEIQLQRFHLGISATPLLLSHRLLYGRQGIFPGARWWSRAEHVLVDSSQPKSLERLFHKKRSLNWKSWIPYPYPARFQKFRNNWAAGMAKASMEQGLPVVHVALTAYEASAIQHGPLSAQAKASLLATDVLIGKLLATALHSSPARAVVVASGKGIQEGKPFQAVYGQSLSALIQGLQRTTSAAEPPQKDPPLVLSTGNMAHIYISRGACLSYPEIERRLPGLPHILRRHPGLAFVACRSEQGVWLGTSMGFAVLSPGETPPSKLALDAQISLSDVQQLFQNPDTGDLVVFGAELEGKLLHFSKGQGCYGAFIKEQFDGFFLSSKSLHLDASRPDLHEQLLLALS